MAGTLRVSRSRGAFSGVLLILLGLWGGLVPLVGPYVHYAYTPDRAWAITSGRIWLEFLPAAATIAGGILVAVSKLRPSALLGASIAAVAGGWFAFGAVISRLLMKTPPVPGVPVGGTVIRALEQIGFFTGLGAVIVCIAAIALGRLSVISVRDTRAAERAATADGDLATTRPSQRNGRGTGDPDSEVTAPTPATSAPVSASSSPAASAPSRETRRTPRASLVRIASRKKAGDQGDGDGSTSADSARDDRVTSGSARG